VNAPAAPDGERGRSWLGGAWSAPRAVPPLSRDQVHVWLASVSELADREPAHWHLLSDDERRRASRFHFARDRSQYVAAHGVLRELLARYVGADPAALHFGAGACGKPFLAGAAAGSGIEFNLAHSGDVVSIAVARGRPVGVDVERWSPDVEYEALAEHVFSPAERAELRALPAERRQEGFFACWSRKEAYIKATGLGVSRGLDWFDVSLTPGAAASLLADRLLPGGAARWTLRDLELPRGHSGAVIAEARDWQLHRLVLTPLLL
jgi:4'-phosphopantetheinyl transferase